MGRGVGGLGGYFGPWEADKAGKVSHAGWDGRVVSDCRGTWVGSCVARAVSCCEKCLKNERLCAKTSKLTGLTSRSYGGR